MEKLLNASFESSIDFSNSSEIVHKLTSKVKTQAQRLRTLDKYKQLCEQRIQELSPSHPLPVEPSHLGSVLQKNTEERLLKFQEENKNLRAKNLNLEEAMRSEITISENQRALIEVLQYKIGEMKPKTNSEYDSQIDALHEELQEKTLECQNLQSQRLMAEDNLKKAEEALLLADEEVSRLEEEKTALLDYVDEHSQIEENLKKDLQKLRTESEAFEAEFNRICSKENIQDSKEFTVRNLEHIQSFAINPTPSAQSFTREESESELAKELEQSKKAYASLVAELDVLKLLNEDLESQKEKFETRNEDSEELQTQINNLERELSAERCSLALAKDEVSSLKNRVKELIECKDQLEQSCIEMQFEVDHSKESTQGILFDLKQAKTLEEEYQSNINSLENKVTQFENQVFTLSNQKHELDEALQDIIENISQMAEMFPEVCENPSPSNAHKITGLLFQELKNTKRKHLKLKEKGKLQAQELETRKIEASTFSDEISGLKEREKRLTEQLEQLTQSTKNIKDNSAKNIRSLQAKVESLNQEMQNNTEKALNLKKEILTLQGTNSEQQAFIDSCNFNQETVELKMNLLSQNKQDLENWIGKIQLSLGTDLSRVVHDIIKIKKDLELNVREKLNFERQILRVDDRSSANSIRTEISKREGISQALNGRLNSLEEDFAALQEAENAKRSFENSSRFNFSLYSNNS